MIKCHFNPQYEANWKVTDGNIIYLISSVVMEDMIMREWFMRGDFTPIAVDKYARSLYKQK